MDISLADYYAIYQQNFLKEKFLIIRFLYNCLVNKFLVNNTSVILYLTDSEDYGQVSVASQYFMTLAQYLRLPMVAWNADNSGTILSITIMHLATHLNPELDLPLCRGLDEQLRAI